MIPIPSDKIIWVLPLLIIPILPNLWGIWHAFTREFQTPQEKMGWIWLNTLLPILGGVLYALFGLRRSRKRTQ